MGNRRANEFLEERRPLFFPHAQITAGLGAKFFTAAREGRLDNATYFNPTGLAAHNDNNFALTVRRNGAKDALTFTAFTFVGEADDDSLTKAAHGLQTGDGPVRVSTDDTLPAGLAAATDYYVIRTGVNTLSLATSRANAYAGVAIDLTLDGTGTHTLSATASTRRPKAIASGVNTDADGGGAALPAHQAVPLTIDADSGFAAGDELWFVAVEGGAATLPLGYLSGEAVYTG